jgi:hypothetical protein
MFNSGKLFEKHEIHPLFTAEAQAGEIVQGWKKGLLYKFRENIQVVTNHVVKTANNNDNYSNIDLAFSSCEYLNLSMVFPAEHRGNRAGGQNYYFKNVVAELKTMIGCRKKKKRILI